MKGVLLKDLYIAKSGIVIALVCLFVLAFGFSFLLDVSSVLMLAPAISTIAVYNSITSDASSKWNKNVITMPVSRDQIIGTKYILYILLSAFGGRDHRSACSAWNFVLAGGRSDCVRIAF